MRRLVHYGGIAASIILITFGISSIAIGFNGRDTVRHNLAQEQIVGTPDSPIAGQLVNTGAKARAFAEVMRKHALEASGGKVYSQMGQYLTKTGRPTDEVKLAAIDPKTKQPVANGARNVWVTETALSTALNTAYFAENVSMFAIVMGFALLLTGGGFAVLTLGPLRRLLMEETERGRTRVGPAAVATR